MNAILKNYRSPVKMLRVLWAGVFALGILLLIVGIDLALGGALLENVIAIFAIASISIACSASSFYLIKQGLKDIRGLRLTFAGLLAVFYGVLIPPVFAFIGQQDDAPGMILIGLFIGMLFIAGAWLLLCLRSVEENLVL